MKTIVLSANDVLKWIEEFKGDDFYHKNDSGFFIVNDLKYTGLDFIGEGVDTLKFFIIYNDSDIISVIKYSEKLYHYKLKHIKNGWCINYLEIAKSYQNKGLLKEVCTIFAKTFDKEVFCSNAESREGKIASVNSHLRKSFTSNGKQFFDSEDDYVDYIIETEKNTI